jgi:hypothetical protein
MSLVNVSRLMNDPAFASHYTVIRQGAKWDGIRFVVGEPETLQYYGPVQPATKKELEQLPEGDRQSGMVKFFCKPPQTLNITSENGEQANVSDEIIYRGQRYKIIAVMDWMPHGYIRAFAYSYGSA